MLGKEINYWLHNLVKWLTETWPTNMPLSHFDEKSGVVAFKTSWGSWWQTVDEVHITINLPNNTKSKDVKVKISANRIECIVHGNIVFMVSFIAEVKNFSVPYPDKWFQTI